MAVGQMLPPKIVQAVQQQQQQEQETARAASMSEEERAMIAERSRLAHAADDAAAKKLSDQGLNPDMSPIHPEYESQIDPNTGLLKDPYQLQVGNLKTENLATRQANGINLQDLAGYNQYKQEALRTGPSAWAKLAMQQQEQQRQANIEKAAAQSASGAAQARSGLAMRGGLSSGQRERLAQSAQRDLLGARQTVGRNANNANLGVLTQDEQNRVNQLGTFMNTENDLSKFNVGADQYNQNKKTEADQFNINNQNAANQFNITSQGKAQASNIQNALQDKQAGNAFKMDTYAEQLKKWGAERQANATAASGGGGGKK